MALARLTSDFKPQSLELAFWSVEFHGLEMLDVFDDVAVLAWCQLRNATASPCNPKLDIHALELFVRPVCNQPGPNR